MAINFIKEFLTFLPGPVNQTENCISELKPHRPLCILLTGLSSSERSLRILRRRLMRDGYNVWIQTFLFQDPKREMNGFEYAAKKLQKLIFHLKSNREISPSHVFILAHSAGGLVGRYYVQVLGGDRECQGLITLATPNQGLWIASLGFFSHLILKAKCLFDILPISPFMRKLNSTPFPKGFPMASFSSTNDLLCPVQQSKLPPKIRNSPLVEEMVIEGVPHRGFLYQQKSYRLIKCWIEKTYPKIKEPSHVEHFKKSS